MQWTVERADEGGRLDHVLAARASISHAAARRVIEEGAVRVNGRRARKGQRLREGDRVAVEGALPEPEALRPVAEPALALAVLHLDDDLVVLNKPAGLATHPLRAGERGTLAGALVARFPECQGVGDDPREAGFAHRLDGETSGAVVAARNRPAWEALRRAFREGAVEKEYLALVDGALDAPGEIDAPIAHDARDRRRVVVLDERESLGDRAGVRGAARPARTHYQPLGRGQRFTLVLAVAATGRMHQVRAHLAHVGHPLVGDALYGGPPALPGAPGHFLHAARLALPHPRGGRLDVRAPLPPERLAALASLGIALPD